MEIFLAWGDFDPNAPTLSTIGIRSSPGDSKVQVVLKTFYLTGAMEQILGSIEMSHADATEKFLSTLKAAFEAPSQYPVVETIPNIVVSIIPSSTEIQARDLFCSAPTLLEADWGRELDLLHRHGPLLFNRAREEWGLAVRQLREEGKDPEELRLLESLGPAEGGDSVGVRPAPFSPFSPEAFDQWWAVMEDTDYLRTALFQFAGAWVGAQHMAAKVEPETLSFEVLRDYMASAGLPLWRSDLTSALLAEHLGIA